MHGYATASPLSEKICLFSLHGYAFLSSRFFYVIKKVIIL